MRALLALDQGTTSSRALVFDPDGNVLGSAQREFPQLFPQPGWVEHDPEEIWSSQYATVGEALKNAGLHASEIAAIGIANQRETTILWDRATSRPVYNAIVWQDRRTARECEELERRGLSPMIAERTGLIPDPYFSATKIAWILDHVDGARTRAERGELAFGTVDSWLVWKLTAGKRHVTDVTNASRTMLFDIRTLQWDEELCNTLRIPQAILPEVLPTTADFGRTAPDLFDARVPIGACAGDQQAALAGQKAFTRGTVKATYGTGTFVVMNTGTEIVRSRSGLIATVAYAFDKKAATYALEGSVFVSGAAIQWLRDGLVIILNASEMDPLAASVPDSGGLVFVPAFTGLGAPHWDPSARGAMFGITRGTTRAHVARATLESIALQTADVLDAMQHDAGVRIKLLRVDGGVSRSRMCMQLQADLIGVPVIRPDVDETTALGAAYLAGLQCGVWPGADQISRTWTQGARYEPNDGADLSELRARWTKALERSLRWATE